MSVYSRLSLFLIVSVCSVVAVATNTDEEISEEVLSGLAQSHDLNVDVLKDYVNSYNFKCPEVMNEYKLESIVLSFDDYTELSIMMESHREQWRDIYIEARSGITCFSEGVVSNAY